MKRNYKKSIAALLLVVLTCVRQVKMLAKGPQKG